MRSSKTDPQLVVLSSGLYRRLLALYPRAFRREYSQHMAQVFRDLCLRAYEHSGPPGILELWALTLLDIIKTVAEQHLQKENSMAKNTFIRLSGWALILGALTFAPFLLFESAAIRVSGFLETSMAIGLFFGPVLIAVGLLGLWARYRGQTGDLGKTILLFGAFGGVIVLIGDIGQSFQPDPFFTIFVVGLVWIFLSLAAFGIIALRKKTLPRWNGLPLLAGIWIPVIVSFSFLGISRLGAGQANIFFALSTLITTLALGLLGYILQADVLPEEELASIQT